MDPFIKKVNEWGLYVEHTEEDDLKITSMKKLLEDLVHIEEAEIILYTLFRRSITLGIEDLPKFKETFEFDAEIKAYPDVFFDFVGVDAVEGQFYFTGFYRSKLLTETIQTNLKEKKNLYRILTPVERAEFLFQPKQVATKLAYKLEENMEKMQTSPEAIQKKKQLYKELEHTLAEAIAYYKEKEWK